MIPLAMTVEVVPKHFLESFSIPTQPTLIALRVERVSLEVVLWLPLDF